MPKVKLGGCGVVCGKGVFSDQDFVRDGSGGLFHRKCVEQHIEGWQDLLIVDICAYCHKPVVGEEPVWGYQPYHSRCVEEERAKK